MAASRGASTTGAVIRNLRREKKLTQAQLARKAGVTVRTLRRLENDETERAYSGTMAGIAAALGVLPAQLDARQLATDVGESADSPARRDAISRLLRMSDDDVAAVLEILDDVKKLRARATKKRRSAKAGRK